MSNINTRIAKLIDEKCNGNKSSFARTIGITPAYAAQLYSGQRAPSDRTVVDICREYNVAESWLRTGEGEMFNAFDREAEIMQLVRKMLDRPQEFRTRLVSALLHIDPDDPRWSLLEDIVDKVAAEYKKEADL